MIIIDRGLYVATSAMMTGSKLIDDISNNIANINTTGYKRDTSIVSKFSNILVDRLNDKVNIGTLNNQVAIEGRYTSFTDGTPTETNNPKDFLIRGDGFFKVQKDGEYRYTRDGSFKTDEQGYLVTADGGYVMNKSNERIIYEDYEDNHIENELMIVSFDDKNTLSKKEDNYYVNSSNLSAEKPVQNPDVRQCMLELSNVDAAQEMTDLMKTQRFFQLNQRSLKANDELLEKIVEF